MKFTHKNMMSLAVSSIVLAASFMVPNVASAQNAEATAAAQSVTQIDAKALMDAGEYKDAIKLLTEAQNSGDDMFETNELLVEAYVQRIDQVGLLKKRGLAIKLRKAMEHSINLSPSSVDARKNLIGFHLQAPGAVGGSKDKARELIRNFPQLTPTEVLIYEAQVSQAEKDPAAAIGYLDKALLADPKSADALMMKGSLQAQQETYADAIASFETCVEYHADNMNCLYQIGKAAHIGDIETSKGIAALEEFITTGGHGDDYTAHAHYRLGSLYVRADNIEAAKTSFEKSISINDLKLAKSALAELK